MTLTKHVQGLYKENYKTEEGNQKRSERDIPCIYKIGNILHNSFLAQLEMVLILFFLALAVSKV